jgi:hypothetical protein
MSIVRDIFIAVLFIASSFSCEASELEYESVVMVYDSVNLEKCKLVAEITGSEVNKSLSSFNEEPIVLGLKNGWRYEAFLLGANLVNVERVYLKGKQQYKPEMKGFFFTSAHDTKRVILYPKAYNCAN